MYKDIQMGAVAKSYMRRGFLIYEETRKYLVIYEEAVSHIWLCNRSHLNFLTWGKFCFLFYQCSLYSLPTWGPWSRRQGRRQWWRGPGSPPSGSNPQAPPPCSPHQIMTNHRVETMFPRGRKFGRRTQLGARIWKGFSQETPNFVQIFLPGWPKNSSRRELATRDNKSNIHIWNK